MEADLYDEFGNYIGPDLESDQESDDEDEYLREEDQDRYVSTVKFIKICSIRSFLQESFYHVCLRSG